MTANIDDKFTKAFNSGNPNVAKVKIARAKEDTELIADNLTGWPTDTAVHFSTYRVDTLNEIIPGTQIDWKGVVNNNSITNLRRLAGAVDDGSLVNDIIEMNPTAMWVNDLMDGILVSLNQDGSLNDAAKASVLSNPILTGLVTLPNESVKAPNVDLATLYQKGIYTIPSRSMSAWTWYSNGTQQFDVEKDAEYKIEVISSSGVPSGNAVEHVARLTINGVNYSLSAVASQGGNVYFTGATSFIATETGKISIGLQNRASAASTGTAQTLTLLVTRISNKTVSTTSNNS